LLLFYSQGYRYDWQRQQFYKIGAIKLASNPSRADIILNGEYVGKTDDLVHNLKAGIYNLKISKDRYLPWQKDVEVLPAETAIFSDIILFKSNEQPAKLFDGLNVFKLSPDKERIAYQDIYSQIWLHDLTKVAESIQLPAQYQIASINWSIGSTKILLETTGTNHQYFIIDKDNTKEIVHLNSLTASTITYVNWDTVSDRFLYWQDDQNIYRYDCRDKKITVSKTDLPADWLAADDQLFMFTPNLPNKLQIYTWSREHTEGIGISGLSDNLLFSNYSNSTHYLVMSDLDNSITNIFSLDQKAVIGQIPIAGVTTFSVDRKYFLIKDQHQLWLWDVDNQTSELLTRVTTTIKDAVFVDNSPYLLFSTEGMIKAVEFDPRHRLIQDLYEIDAEELYVLNKNNLAYSQAQPTKIDNSSLFNLVFR